MWMSRVLGVVLLGLPLGGCFGLTLPPQPLPDWAMSPQAQANDAQTVPRKKPRVVRHPISNELTAASSALVTGSAGSGTQPVARAVDTKAFAPGWDTPEYERDPSPRRTLNICRGC
jgi:hypothetical protein